MSGHLEAVQLLLERGANPNIDVIWKVSVPEILSVLIGSPTPVYGELQFGQIRIVSQNGEYHVMGVADSPIRRARAIHVAAATGNRALVDALVARGASIDAPDEAGLTAAALLDHSLRGRIVVFRISKFAAKLMDPVLTLNDTAIAEMDNARWFAATVYPGNWRLVVQAEGALRETALDVAVASGQTQYVRMQVPGGILRERPWDLQIVPSTDAQAEIARRKLKGLGNDLVHVRDLYYLTR